MCFRIKINRNGSADTVKTAKQAIVCYKAVDKGPKAKKTSRSHIQGFRYNLNRKVNAKFDVQGLAIEAGLHSYKTRPKWTTDSDDIAKRKSSGTVTMLCVIPKGAKYYENKTEYCSNQIIPVAYL